MQTVGIVLILCGAYLIYETLRSRLASQPASSSSSPGGGTSGGANPSSSATSTDSGQHQALDLTGAVTGNVGNVYTVDSTYGNATDQQKDDMNAYARQIGNVGG